MVVACNWYSRAGDVGTHLFAILLLRQMVVREIEHLQLVNTLLSEEHRSERSNTVNRLQPHFLRVIGSELWLVEGRVEDATKQTAVGLHVGEIHRRLEVFVQLVVMRRDWLVRNAVLRTRVHRHLTRAWHRSRDG